MLILYATMYPGCSDVGGRGTRSYVDVSRCSYRKYMITSQHTGLSGAARPIQMNKPISLELCIGRPPIERFQPINGHPSVIIGCNRGKFLEALGTAHIRSRLLSPQNVTLKFLGTVESRVDSASCLQNPQYVPLRDALTMHSPLSLPRMSFKTSETDAKKKDTQTFENDSIFGGPKIAKRLQGPIRHNMYKFRVISENIELVRMPEILSRVDFNTVPVCFRQCREFCIKMRVVPESQT